MNNNLLDVTVCILSFNRASYLTEAVASVMSQTIKPVDIRIYDNGSDAAIYNSIRRYLDSGVQWFTVENPSHNCQQNFRRAVHDVCTKYIVMMHDDDRLCENFIENQIKLLESNKCVVAVSCNGYLVDEFGTRTGRLIFSDYCDMKIEMYSSSGDVAMRYASDRCIPFSPAVYQTEVLRQVNFREEYDKVVDAVLFCDLADVGIVAYQSNALYECRIHDGQDSNYISAEVLEKFYRFLWTRKTKNNEDKINLHKLLISQQTSHKLQRILKLLTRPHSLRDTIIEFGKFRNGVFSPSAAVNIIFKAVMKRFFGIYK